MNKEQQSVKSWMTKAGQGCPESPQIPSLEIRKLRARLILEEAFELINKGLGLEVQTCPDEYIDSRDIYFEGSAENEPDLIELADGIADLQVVNLGTAVACGIDIEPAFEEVMRSNNSKWWTAMQVDSDAMRPGYLWRQIGENSWVVTDKTGKIMKPPTFTHPNIKPILEGQKR